MLVRTAQEQPFKQIATISILLIAFVISSEISNVSAFSLTKICNSALTYDFARPINIVNLNNEWNQENAISSCNLSIKIDTTSKPNIQTSFIIKYEINRVECEANNKSIILNTFTDRWLTKENLCELNSQTNSLRNFQLINASQDFLINLLETNTPSKMSFPFELIKSITITSYNYVGQSKFFFLFIYLDSIFLYNLG